MKCPTCSRPILWNADFPQRPFCSERCRLIDLGDWMSERHAIPGEEVILPDAPGSGDGDPPRH